MNKEKVIKDLKKFIKSLNKIVSTNKDEWVVKGFIDVFRNIYTISNHTKVVSKIIELLIFPEIIRFAKENNYKITFAKEQNHYPDITLHDKENKKYAIDIKSTYFKTKEKINGMTLGTFTGYFRDRKSTKNITFPYNEYDAHIVLGLLYLRNKEVSEVKKYNLEQLEKIPSVIKNITFFIQEKYKIASDKPGSGNTKNIGSVTHGEKLINGNGIFSKLGEQIFNDYWMYYLTNDMAKKVDLPKQPYKNLQEYYEYKKIGFEK